MSTPLYRGAAIFGTSPQVRTDTGPRAKDLRGTFGLSGLECLDGGRRATTTTAAGTLSGYGALGLGEAEGLFRSYLDGLAGTLTDTNGTSWAAVQLRSFEPLGRIRQSQNGTWFRQYRASFLHLV